MIKVTRLDGVEYYLNPHQIESIEVHPDTTLAMLTGKRLIVREKVEEVIGRIEEYRRRLFPSMGEE
ncbi:MAG: flagellar FlbD family protein [Treponema sp.]|jgi:flagellar protein FlbD|nr:flagellar FlbD family protein [Treponema sp.]